MTWFPALEANQGALSLAALVLALTLALWEQHRANEQDRRELKRELEQVLDLLSRVAMDLRSDKTFDDVRLILPAFAGVVRGFATAQARRPSLALALLSTANATDAFVMISGPSLQQRRDFSTELVSYYMELKEGERGLDWRGFNARVQRRQAGDRRMMGWMREAVRKAGRDSEGLE